VIERNFLCSDPSYGKIAITSLGFFILYVNGQRVGEDYFRPSNSLFHERPNMQLTFPITDRFTYRCYYSVYDLSPYLKKGENRLEIALGSGWYRQTIRLPEGRMSFGENLGARYAMEVDGTLLCSDGTELFRNSPLVYDQLYRGEIFDARIKEFSYRPVSVIELPNTELNPEVAPPDRVDRRIKPLELRRNRICKIYDAGENISGFATLRVYAPRGYEVRVRFAEELHSDGTMDFSSAGRDRQMQEDVYISDGTEQIWEPRFVWHGFRYLEVLGDAEVE
jgi:alpha-L-rhamnosidase